MANFIYKMCTFTRSPYCTIDLCGEGKLTYGRRERTDTLPTIWMVGLLIKRNGSDDGLEPVTLKPTHPWARYGVTVLHTGNGIYHIIQVQCGGGAQRGRGRRASFCQLKKQVCFWPWLALHTSAITLQQTVAAKLLYHHPGNSSLLQNFIEPNIKDNN